MVFSSLTFICIFLPVVFLLTLAVPGRRFKNLLLAVFSLVFYAYGEPVYVLLMLASTIVNWALGLLIEHSRPENRLTAAVIPEDSAGTGGRNGGAAAEQGISQKLLLAAAVVINLAFLGFFKYSGMLVSTINSIFGSTIAEPDISLPIGISFYTFQAMSYVIDVYRGEVRGQRNYLKILLYISFFPQRISGPIVRYRDIEGQLDNRKITLQGTAEGFRRFCFGFAKKVLIANTMGVAADAIFGAELSEINIAGAWIGALAYFMQIYFDFSGYSDMAIGIAEMFGFKYRENFLYPYASTTVREFWRRWHISLSTWLKEYLYIPLGGSRKGRARTVLNKLIVFFCCGLWHGAAWTFVVWGLIHGFFLLLEEYLPIHKLPKVIGWIYTTLVAALAFVIFRADTLGQGLQIIAKMFTGFGLGRAAVSLAVQQLTPLFIVTFVFAVAAAAPIRPAVRARTERSLCPQVWNGLGYLLALVLFVLSFLSLASGGYNPFIYFRF